jgi:glycosyltransferase involved in cell wall biosynthesis
VRIVYVCKRFPKYSETFIRNEIRSLVARGLDIRIVSLERPHPGDPSIETTKDLRHRTIHLKDVALPSWIEVLADPDARAWLPTCVSWSVRTRSSSHLRRLREAVAVSRLSNLRGVRRLHAHFAHGPASTGMIAADMMGIPFSFSAHARDLYELTPAWMLREKARRASFVAVEGEVHANYLLDLGIAPERVKVIRNAVAATIPAIEDAIDVRNRRPLTVLSVARFVPKKGHDVLLDAFARLARDGFEFRARLIGGGDLHSELKARVDDLGLNERVDVVGWKSEHEVFDELAKADVFALPSRVTSTGDRDGLPVAILEAMAAGLPIVSTSVSAIPEAVGHGSEGFLVPPDDPDALARALAKLLEDESLRAALGKRARRRVLRDFSVESSATQLIELYQARDRPA